MAEMSVHAACPPRCQGAHPWESLWPSPPLPFTPPPPYTQPDLDSTEEGVEELRARELLRVAVLEDGSTWCLLTADHLQGLQVGEGGEGGHRSSH